MPKPKPRRASNRIAKRSVRPRSRLHSTTQVILAANPAPSGEVWKAARPKLAALCLLSMLVALLVAFFQTDLFYIFDFRVRGLKYLDAAEVQRASGIMGYNVFFIEPQSVERALGRLPEIKTARVTLSVPNQLAIEVEERRPELAWLRGAESFWVDADSIAFRARTNLPELATVRDLDQSPLKAGQKVVSAGITAARALRQAWPDAPRTLEWSAARGLSFSDERGWKIYLGGADEMRGKVAKYRALVPQLVSQNARIKFVDLGQGDPYYQ